MTTPSADGNLAELAAIADRSLGTVSENTQRIRLPDGSSTYIDITRLRDVLSLRVSNSKAFEERIDATLYFGAGGSAPKSLTVSQWAEAFLLKWFEQVRSIVCSDQEMKEVGRASGVTAAATVNALAAWIVASLGISNPVAIGLGAAVLMIIATTGRSTFCSMSKQMLVQEIQAKQSRIADLGPAGADV